MTYHINVSSSNLKEFLRIMQSLRSLGVIESMNSSKDLIREGGALDDETILNIVKNSEKEIEEGKLFSMKQVKDQIESWKNR